MVYCEQSMCESKLGKLMQAFRADRPDEWSMDEFIGMAEDMNKANDELVKMNQELLAALEGVVDARGSKNETFTCAYMALENAKRVIEKVKGGTE